MINASKRSLFSCLALLMPFIYLLANSADYHPPLKLANSPFTFTETEITAHPGETVQVCVDKAARGLFFGTTSIVVDAVGNTSPHLSDFAPVTLIFPSGVTQACFDLEIGESSSSINYQLVLLGLEEHLELKVESGRELGLCGAVSLTTNINPEEAVVFDNFGNYYSQAMVTLPEIDVPTGSVSSDGSGSSDCGCEEFEEDDVDPIQLDMFQVFFEDCIYETGSGFDEVGEIGRKRRKTICATLQYLETVLVPVESVCEEGAERRVNIQIQPSSSYTAPDGSINLGEMDDNVLGYAGSYMTRLRQYEVRRVSITYPSPWVVINTGEYPEVLNADCYHALARFNFDNFDFFTDYSSPISESTFDDPYDLYSVALHEFLHALGFASSFASESQIWGSTDPNISSAYTPFDKFLRYRVDADIELPLIEEGNSIDGYDHNPLWYFNEIITPTSLYDGCLGNTSAVEFSGGLEGNHLIHTGDVFSAGTSFSHFFIDCTGDGIVGSQLVMKPAFAENTTARILQDMELDVLRQIGYNINCDNADYPNLDCDFTECIAGAAFDGFFAGDCSFIEENYTLYICPPEAGTISIPISDILANDVGVGQEEGEIAFALVQNEDEESISISEDGNALLFTSNILGTRPIAYAPIGCNGEPTNTAIITINVKLSEDPDCVFFCLEEIPACDIDNEYCTSFFDSCEELEETSPCNLICNPGLCSTWTSISSPNSINPFACNTTLIDGSLQMGPWFLPEGRVAIILDGANNPDVPNPFFQFLGYPRLQSVMTYANIEPDKSYFLAVDIIEFRTTAIAYHSGSINIEALRGQDVIIGPDPCTFNDPGTILPESELVFERSFQAVEEEPGIKKYLGYFSISQEDWNGYSAFRIFPTPDPETGKHYFGFNNFEVVPDDFSAGNDFFTNGCGETAEIGGVQFCTIADLNMEYEWFRLETNGNSTSLGTFRIKDGVVLEVIGLIDPDNLTVQIAPAATTTYRLERRIIENLSSSPEFTLDVTSDEITVEVLNQSPDASFTEFSTACGVYNFTVNVNNTDASHEWYIDGALLGETENLTNISLNDGSHEITHVVNDGSCVEGVYILTIMVEDCENCPTPPLDYNYSYNCENETWTFSASPLSSSHKWSIPTLSIDETGSQVDIVTTTLNPGIYEVIYMTENTCGQTNTTSFEIEIIDQIDDASFSFDVDLDDCTVTLIPNSLVGDHEWWDFTIPANPVLLSVAENPVVNLGNDIYDIVHTLSNTCESIESDIVTIDISNDPTFTATETDCGIYKLAANPTTVNIDHSWYLVDNGMPQQLFSNLYEPENIILPNGDHTIVHTVSNGCVSANFEIEINGVDCNNCATPMSGFTVNQDCENSMITFSATSPNYNHQWEINGSTYFGTIVTLPVVDPGMNEIYSVTHTVTNECAESNTLVEEVVGEACIVPCPCEDNDALTIYADDGTSIWSTALGPLINVQTNTLNTNDRCIELSGRLLIPSLGQGGVDLSFFPGEIRMQPGAEVVIEEGANVQFRTSGPSGNPAFFSGCESLWQSITVESDASFTMTGIRVEDAQAAVYAMDNAIVELRDNIFRKNFIGVYHFGSGFELLSSSGNSIDGSEYLLPSLNTATLFPTQIGSKPYAGFYLQFDFSSAPAATIGVEEGAPNVFSNIPVGVYAGGMIDVLMRNNRFSNIQPSAEDTYPLEGEGVYMNGFTGASLQFNGTLNSFPRAFENCYRGILTRNTATEVFNTSMDCYAVGIQIENCNAQIHLHENTLRLPGWGIGINLLQNNGATDLLIEHNDITIETPVGGPLSVTGGKGIAIEEANARPEEFLAEVSYNTININSGVNDGGLFGDDPRYRGAGIFLNSVNNLDLEYNRDIHCLFTDDIGILVQNCEDLLLLDNHVFGISGSVGTGILAEASQDVTYSCNGMLYLRHGLEFTAGTALGSNIVQNNFIPPMTNGLVYRDMLTIEGQAHRENRWSGSQGSYFGAAALNEGSVLSIVQNQLYTVTSTFLPPSILLSNFPGQEELWFDLDQNPNPLSSCTLESFTSNENEGWYRRIAEGTAITGAYLQSRQWMSQRALYDKLEVDAASGTLSSELQSFLVNESNSPLGKYHEVKTGASRVLVWNDLSGWRNSWQDKRSKLRKLVTMRDELLSESPSSYTWEDHENLQNSLAVVNAELYGQWQNDEATRNVQLNGLISQNTALSVTLTAQQNEKDLNELLFTTVLANSLNWTSTQEQTLLNIGNQCPLEGGEVVYTARSLYQLIDPTHEFPNTCVTVQALQEEQQTKGNVVPSTALSIRSNEADDQVGFNVFPNPASNELVVRYTNGIQLEVYSTFGVLVMETPLDTSIKQSVLDVRKLASGVYYLRLEQADGTTQTRKVVINH